MDNTGGEARVRLGAGYAVGVLEEVNARGIVVPVEAHVGQPAQPLFYPWGAVIQLPEARER